MSIFEAWKGIEICSLLITLGCLIDMNMADTMILAGQIMLILAFSILLRLSKDPVLPCGVQMH